MTQTARKVLDDCSLILEMMEREADADRLRVLWIGALALIRMVGHVLHKIDSENSEVSSRLAACWPALKSDPLFDEFIHNSRNRALKEYELSLYDHSTIVVISNDEHGREKPHLFNECLFMPLMEGFRSGEDGRDVYRDAIRWWDGVLSGIEGV